MSGYTPSGKLNFTQELTGSATLNFGADGNPADQTYTASAALSFTISLNAEATYSTNVFRGLVASAQSLGEYADLVQVSAKSTRYTTERLTQSAIAPFEIAVLVKSDQKLTFDASDRLISDTQAVLEPAKLIGDYLSGSADYLLFTGADHEANSEYGELIGSSSDGRFEGAVRLTTARRTVNHYAQALGVGLSSSLDAAALTKSAQTCHVQYARMTRLDAKRVIVVVPPVDYGDGLLNFVCKWETPSARLNFGAICQYQPPAPTQTGVLFVANSVSLTRTDDGREISLFSCDVGIDNQSFCWSFSAEVAYQDLGKVDTSAEDQIGVTLVVNDQNWTFILSDCNDSSEFGRDTLRISGKSRSVLLAHPYFDHRGFIYDQPITTRAIAEAELERGGAPSGFTLDWDLVDTNGWLVDRYSYTNRTPVNVLQDIAQAAGGFLSTHPSDDVVVMRSNYPVPSWEWRDLTPSVVITNSLITSRSRSRVKKPAYTGALVSGERTGSVSGLIKRSGTSGSYQGDQVTHALITDQSVAIHRGKCELSNTGDMGEIGLEMPFVSDTGLLLPSDFVRIDDAVSWVGKVTGTSISLTLSGNESLDVSQRVNVERHWDKEAAA